MKLCFRELFGANRLVMPRELYIVPAVAKAGARRALAELVLSEGVSALQQSEGPLEAVVIDADPTLDDMLAATFSAELLAGRSLPPGCKEFARYAALEREGLHSGELPIKDSLQGIYLALRASAGRDLTDAATAERFLADWQRVAAVILPAAAAGKDPFTGELFSAAEFARERAFLAEDFQVFQQDVRRGRQWLVDVPGGAPASRALVLERPKSLLFKNWSRAAGDKSQDSYLFLGVNQGSGHWVFSTDPVQRLPIDSLAAVLQTAETAKHPDATRDPWFDGAPFGHTLVAAPRAGSRLSEAEILGVVRKWSHAREVGRPSRRPLFAAAAALVAVASLAFFWRGSANNDGPLDEPTVAERFRGDQALRISDASKSDPPVKRVGRDYALLFATDKYDHWSKLENAVADVRKIGEVLKDKYGFNVIICEGYDLAKMNAALVDCFDPKRFTPDSQLLIYFAGHGDYMRQSMTGYVVAKDSKLGSDAAARSLSCLSLAQLSDYVTKMPCGHVFVVLDTCFGGTIEFGVATGKLRGAQTPIDVSKSEFIARKIKHRCRRYLASVQRDFAVDGPAEGHSPFAARFIQSLENDGQDDGIVTVEQIISRVEHGYQEPQYGWLPGHEPGGDFLFIAR